MKIATVLFATVLPAVLGNFGPNSEVVQLTANNFKKEVNEAGVMVITMFYAPWCGHCTRMMPDLSKAAAKLKKVGVKIAACDADTHGSVGSKYGVRGFPTLKMFWGREVIDYNGPRDARGLIDYAIKQLPSKVKKINAKNLDVFLDSTTGKLEGIPRALLFTEKDQTSSMYKSISLRFQGKLVVGEARKTESEVVEKFGISEFPTLLMFKGDGDHTPDKYQKYSGDMSFEAIGNFLNKLALDKPKTVLGAKK